MERRLQLPISPGDVTIRWRRTSIERGARGLDELENGKTAWTIAYIDTWTAN